MTHVKQTPWTPNMRLSGFVLLIAFANLALFQKPLLAFVFSVSSLPDATGWLQLASVQIVQLCLFMGVLFLVSALSLRLMKLLVVLLFIVNAAALYFMLSYSIEIDRSMIANVLNTDTGEASGLWHWSILPYLAGFGALPALFVWRVDLRAPKRSVRLFAGVASFGLLIAWLFATSTTWLWFDQHASRMGSKVLPWSYVINTARYYNKRYLDEREPILSPPATFAEERPDKKQVVVLVIGEAARAENFGLYGYGRETNTFTKETSLFALPLGQSCATNTIGSTACILTHEGSKASSHTLAEPLPSYLTRQGIETIYRSNNSGPPPVKTTVQERAGEISLECTEEDCPKGDAALNWRLAERIEQSNARRIFVTLHQTGSHGPAYFSKYPQDFARFTPECKTVQVAKCTHEELVNAYDNSILYTDYLLADLIKQLESLDAETVLIYVSDHGQSLGEGGYYLHGLPNSVAPKEQRDVPFLIWMSDSFASSRGLTAASVLPPQSFPHDFPFHSVMGAFGMTSDIYKPEFDIFHLTR